MCAVVFYPSAGHSFVKYLFEFVHKFLTNDWYHFFKSHVCGLKFKKPQKLEAANNFLVFQLKQTHTKPGVDELRNIFVSMESANPGLCDKFVSGLVDICSSDTQNS